MLLCLSLAWLVSASWEGVAPLASAAAGDAGADGPSRAAAGPTAEPLSLPRPVVIGRGVQYIRELDEYLNAGFNAAYIRVDPIVAAQGWQAVDDFLVACGHRQLPVFVELSALPTPGSRLRMSPYDGQYRLLARDWLTEAAGHLRQFPAVAAYVTQGRLQAHLSLTEEDFRAYLQEFYGTLDAVSESWGTNLLSWEQVTFAHAQFVDNLRSMGIGRSTLDIAQFRIHAISELLTQWGEAIRRADRVRPIFAGEEYLYRGLLCIPPGFAGVFTGMYPDEAELDLLTHNVQAVDIGRQGGSLAVIAGIRARSAVAGETLAAWATEAFLHGSIGVAVDDWQVVEKNGALGDALRRATSSWRDDVGEFHPMSNLAVLLEPFADGAVNEKGEGLFGFLEGFSPGEPSRLIYALRLGHRFGLVDYLTPLAIAGADLSHYSAILIPEGLDISDDLARILTAYASDGGIVIADLGLGMFQGGSVARIPLTLRPLFGVMQMVNVREASANFRVIRAVPPIPSWGAGQTSLGVPSGCAFQGPIGDARLVAGAACFALVRSTRDRGGRLARSGLILCPVGAGFGVFSTGRLFANWGPEDPLFNAMLSDLLSRRASFELVRASGAAEGAGFMDESVAAATDSQKIVVYNRSAAQQDFLLKVPASAGTLFLGATVAVGAAPAGISFLRVSVKPGEVRAVRPVPMAVDDSGLEVSVDEYSKQGMTVRTGKAASGESPSEVTVRVGTGEYAISPGSTHSVRVEAEAPGLSRTFQVSAAGNELVLANVPVPAVVQIAAATE